MLTLPFKNLEDTIIARQRARQVMRQLGYNRNEQTRMVTALSEIARNACQYADGGVILFVINRNLSYFTIYITDQGQGIPNLPIILDGKFISKTGLGLGIPGTRRLVDNFDISSSPIQGTQVTLSLKLPLNVEITPKILSEIAEALVHYRPTEASEELHQQNQELINAFDLLKKARDELEGRVMERTQELIHSNQTLQNEIDRRKETEQSLKEVYEKTRIHREQMIEAARTSALGEMASSLAHEINQPLATINVYTQGCIKRIESENFDISEIHKILSIVVRQAERAGQVIHRIRNFVKKGELLSETLELNVLIQESIQIMQYEIEKFGVEVVCHHPSILSVKVNVDKIQIQQVMLNLIRNAMECMQESQIIDPQVIIQVLENQDDSITVSVSDTGPGIADEIMPRLFETYFSTKVQGMGLGLSICRSIIEAHGGQLVIFNRPLGGSCFQFNLSRGT